MKRSPSPVALAAKVAVIAGVAALAALATSGGCGPGGDYRIGPGPGGRGGEAGRGSGLAGAPGTGGGTGGGSGGMLAETGGAAGLGIGGAAGGPSASGGRASSGGSGGGAGASTGGQGGSTSPGTGGGGAGVGGATTGTGGGTAGSGGLGGSGGMAPGGRTGGGGAPSTGGAPGSGGSAGGGAGGRGGGGSGGAGGSGGMGGGPLGSGGRRILSLDFVGGQVTSFGGAGGKTVTPMPMALTEVAGVKPAANWNSASGAASSGAGLTSLLLDNGSTAGSAAITWNASTTATSPGVYSAGLTDEPGDVRMMNGYLDPAGGATPTATIAVTGLPAPFTTSSYDVYVYFLAALAENQTRSHQLTLTTPPPGNYNMSVTVSQTGPTMPFSGYTLATSTTGNYVVFKKVTGSQFTLTSAAVMTTTMALRAPVNGFQIVWPSGS